MSDPAIPAAGPAPTAGGPWWAATPVAPTPDPTPTPVPAQATGSPVPVPRPATPAAAGPDARAAASTPSGRDPRAATATPPARAATAADRPARPDVPLAADRPARSDVPDGADRPGRRDPPAAAEPDQHPSRPTRGARAVARQAAAPGTGRRDRTSAERTAGGRAAAGRDRARRRATSPAVAGPGGRGPRRPAADRAAAAANRRPLRRGAGRLLGLALLLVALVLAVGLYTLTAPFAGDGEGEVVVNVPEGSTVGGIGDQLAEAGVVRNGVVFGLRARLSGEAGALRAGRVALRRDMSYGAAITALTTVPEEAPTISVTVPEGLSRREVARRLEGSGVSGDYLEASRSSEGFDPSRYGRPSGEGSTLEGFLFPATYELPRDGATARRLVRRQVEAFEENLDPADVRAARREGLDVYELLTVASMIEREVTVAEERREVSGVIANRLEQGIPLGIDATIRFAEDDWQNPLRESQLQRDGPYNTRLRQGLPAGPIGSPSAAAIRAAARPAETSALYYVVKPCGNGRHTFADTDPEFQQAVAVYQRAQAERGGDPSQC